VIAQSGGDRVFAVDKYLSEIQEAMDNSPISPWLVADASELPCEDECFDGATAFFSCMYITNELKEKVFKEIWRALKPEAEFWIWDVRMLAKSELYSIRLKVELPGSQIISTMYGVRAKEQSAVSMCGLLQKAGFTAEININKKYWFLIKAKKKQLHSKIQV
jgi:ubiquinone/menaquinone biosynthesis C-methylase UbiE